MSQPPTTPTKVLIIDDHAMVRDALSRALGLQEGIEVVGVAGDSEQGIEMAGKFQPRVVLLDLCMHGRGAFEVAQELLALGGGTRVLVLSGFLADVFISQCLRLRLSGYVLKGETVEFLAEAIRHVAAGGTSYSPAIEERVVFDPLLQCFVAKYESELSLLTGRQVEVLRHLACGQSVKEIARIMHLSQKSVDSHKYRIMNKLAIHDRVELARFAIREGLMVP